MSRARVGSPTSVLVAAVVVVLALGSALLAVLERHDARAGRRAAQALVDQLEGDEQELDARVLEASTQAGPQRDLRRRRERELALLRRRASAAGEQLAAALTAAADLLRSDQDQAALGAELVGHLRSGRNRLYNTRRNEFNQQYVDAGSPGVRAYERLEARIGDWTRARPRIG